MINIKIESITVKTYRIICIAKFDDEKYSNEKIKKLLLEKVPSLANHKCRNASNADLSSILDKTSLAHVMEHLIIDFQVKAADKNNVIVEPLFGTSKWMYEYEGIAKIEFTYYDDIVALNSIKQSMELLQSLSL